MNNFKILNLPTFDLYQEFIDMDLKWTSHKQICINTPIENNDNIDIGVGSLMYDWDNSYTDKNGKLHVPHKDIIYRESDFKHLCTRFKNTAFEHVYNDLKKLYKIGRVRLMRSDPKTCLTWHTDDSPRLHYPLKTQDGCFMVIDNEIMHLNQNVWYWTNTTIPHTAFNGSKDIRIHLVVTLC